MDYEERLAVEYCLSLEFCPIKAPFKLFPWYTVVEDENKWWRQLTLDLVMASCPRKEAAHEEAVAFYKLAKARGLL